jgi:hypothetical protein
MAWNRGILAAPTSLARLQAWYQEPSRADRSTPHPSRFYRASRAAGGPEGAVVRMKPGSHTGAVPLRSAQIQSVVGGLVVRQRFEWAGVGRVLQKPAGRLPPEFLALRRFPGSGREIPPGVLAGPVIGRLAERLRAAKRGYRERWKNLKRPRGRILWAEYTCEQMPRGKWDTLPCRYSDLATDPKLRRSVRRGLERVGADLLSVRWP